MSGGVGNADVLYGAPLFETGDPRYAWLNQVQAVFRGVVGAEVPSTTSTSKCAD
jgi:hypothetical protein